MNVGEQLVSSYDVELECIVNEVFHSSLEELRQFAATQTSELKCPLLRLIQIEELLGRHVTKIAKKKRSQATRGTPPPEA